MKIKYTITAFAENSPGVLYRISNLFLRRKINISSLTVSESVRSENLARFTIVVESDLDTVEKIVKQLYKIVEVTKVYENTDEDIVFKEVALIKISTETPEKRRELIDIVNLHNAKVVIVEKDYLIIQKTGKESSIDSLLEIVTHFGIKELARSGRIALKK
jgi:acetolactate synthase I/III small subunit